MFNFRRLIGIEQRVGPCVRLPGGEVYGAERTAVCLDNAHRYAFDHAERIQQRLGRPARVLELGGASGEFGFSLAAGHGCAVTIIDQGDFGEDVARRNKNLYHAIPPMRFVRGDLRYFDFAVLDGPFDLVFGSRFFNFLNPPEGRGLMQRLQPAMHDDTRVIFLLSHARQDRQPDDPRYRPWPQRFHAPPLFSLQRILTGTNVPIMHYYPSELRGLFDAAGWQITHFAAEALAVKYRNAKNDTGAAEPLAAKGLSIIAQKRKRDCAPA